MPSNPLSAADDIGPSRVRVHLDRPTHTIDRKIYGLFAEHLGRCIYEGVYQEDSPLSDAAGFRKDVRSALKELEVPTIRWPGGFFATYYHWLDGVGLKSSRPQKLNVPWKQTESNHFGTTEFIDYCRQLEAEPQIVINCLNGTVEEALGWLEYCNLSTDTHYAQPLVEEMPGVASTVAGGSADGHEDLGGTDPTHMWPAEMSTFLDEGRIHLHLTIQQDPGQSSPWLGKRYVIAAGRDDTILDLPVPDVIRADLDRFSNSVDVDAVLVQHLGLKCPPRVRQSDEKDLPSRPVFALQTAAL